jgi:hypothetical protein
VTLNLSLVSLTDHKTENELDALTECYEKAWICCSATADSEPVFFFASPLHRWSAGLAIWQENEPITCREVNILDFVLRVVKSFSASRLFPTHQIHSSYVQHLPGPQCPQEFYRCCDPRNVQIFPDFGSRPGHVDFYIPAKRWAIELLYGEENTTREPCMRFSGVYSHPCMPISDHMILDCRQNRPTRGHSGT